MNAIRIALVGMALVAAGCINVEPIDGIYQCQIDSDCPKNYYCDGASQTCWQHGHVPAVVGDMAMNDLAGTDSPLCHDGVQNGDETDIDCGGGTCAACAAGGHCAANRDCLTMLCNAGTGTCAGTRCDDGVKDGNETDVDCGGGACAACVEGRQCTVNADCATNICSKSSNTCVGSLCADGTKDGMETDVDCGGGSCNKCLGGKLCDGNSDCLSNICGVNHTCAKSLCENGVKDPGETDIDCGGTTCSGCGLTKACLVNGDCAMHFCNVMTLTCVADQCHDGLTNGDETDIDCGGACGNTCKVGAKCKVAGDCASGTCGANNTCVATQCMDGTLDGNETDKDCGGGTCPTCMLGQKCADGTRDCSTHYCNATSKICVADQCHDGAKDGSESDADCGGGTCAKCGTGLGCNSANDCSSMFCNKDSLKCVATQCQDGIKDNGESDIDCGGGSATMCPTCADGKGCGTVDANCVSGVCNYTTGLCVHTACSDGRLDGSETDQDCGGGSCSACGVGLTCKVNGDCGSSACDFGPAPHKCIVDACLDHHQDGNETDLDCGGGTCATCATGKKCAQGTDCQTGYCDPTSHVCACGGLGQACCTGGSCSTPSNLCNGTVSCSSTNICVQANPVTCPAAPNVCQMAGTCNPSTGMCSAPTNVTGPCDLHATDQCIVANTSACSNGQCAGGTHVADRCVGNDAQTCNNNNWTTKQTCANGCTGNGVCNVPTPTVTATASGSDVIVSWTTVASGVTCALLRNDGAGYQAPASIITPCPASVQGACNAYDHFLFRGSYTYELRCTDTASGATATSAPTSAVQPALELCIGDRGTAVEVHSPSGNTNDHPDRTLSASASLNYTYGIAYAPPASGHTNCAWNDSGCGKIFVTSYMTDQVMSFNRRAYDGSGNDPSPELPNAHEQILTLLLKDTNGNKLGTAYRPIGAAVVGNEVVVAMFSAAGAGFLAGYPLTFTSGSPTPDWFMQASAGNALSSPLSVAVDATGSASGDVYVGSGNGTTYVVNGYHVADLQAGINTINHQNGSAAPFVSFAPPSRPDALAVDQTNHIVYVGTLQTNQIYRYQISGSTATQQPTMALGSVAVAGLAFDGGTLYLTDNTNGLIQSYAVGATTPTINFPVSGLISKAAGIVVCN